MAEYAWYVVRRGDLDYYLGFRDGQHLWTSMCVVRVKEKSKVKPFHLVCNYCPFCGKKDPE